MHSKTLTYLIILTAVLTMCGCGEQFNPNVEFIKVDPESKKWLVNENHMSSFILSDSTNQELFEFTDEWSGIYMYTSSGFNNEETEYQAVSQNFESNFESDFSIRLEANQYPQGTNMVVEMNNVRYSYDLKYRVITNISTTVGYKYRYFFRDRYHEEDTIYSTIEFFDTLFIGNQEIPAALKFKLNDFKQDWEPSLIEEIIIAKGIGLIGYSQVGGKEMLRYY